jgi:hypothetical protein
MSMYVEVLSGALDSWTADLGDDELLEYVLACLLALPAPADRAGRAADATLATEVAYDCALIKLAATYDIEVETDRYLQPVTERHRLESALAERGIDLRALVVQRRIG